MSERARREGLDPRLQRLVAEGRLRLGTRELPPAPPSTDLPLDAILADPGRDRER